MTAPFDADGDAPVPITLDRLTPNADYQPRGAGLSESHVRLLAAEPYLPKKGA